MKCVIFLVTAVGLLLAASSLLPTDMSTTRANKSASWFVSPSPVGDDLSGDGTWDKPFATIQKAIDRWQRYRPAPGVLSRGGTGYDHLH
jgi:hypothetical protein